MSRATIGAATAALVLSLLCGCDALPNDPTAIRLSDGVVEVELCQTVEIEVVSLDERGSHTDRFWEPFWYIDKAPEGWFTSRISGVTPDGSGDDYRSARLRGGDELSVFVRFVAAEKEDSVITSYFVVPEDGLPDEAWLKSDGTLSDEPCS